MSTVPTTDLGPRAPPHGIFTPNFVVACLTTFASFTGFYLLLSTLPPYVKWLGGSEGEVGIIVGVFSATAVVFRLPMGWSADRRGRRRYILAGSLGLAVCSFLYLLLQDQHLLIALRMVHGAMWAAYGTAVNALVADTVPRDRRGEALGYFGMFSNVAMAIGPALGFALSARWGFVALFAAAAFISLVAFAVAWRIKEPAGTPSIPSGAPPEGQQAHRPLAGMLEPTALFPSGVLALAATTYGAIVSFVSIYAVQRGLANPGWFFTAYAVTLVVARSFTGKLSDRYGRAAVIAPGLLLSGVALALLSLADSTASFLGCAVVYGLGFAAMQPALMALIVDRAPVGRRGAAMGMFAVAMDLGIACGSFAWGFVAQLAGYEAMYVSAGALTLVALLVFVLGVRRSPAPCGARR